MKTETQTDPGMSRIAKLIDDVRVCMLTTQSENDTLVSRPMMALELDAYGRLWFFTNAQSGKVDELQQVNLAFADPDDGTYVSISGHGQLIRDRARTDELWSPMAKPWFPEGKDDPNLALLCVTVRDAEYWDSNSSKMMRLLALATSAAAGKPVGMGDHGKVHNPAS
jgi:general stress protein 26